MMTIFLWPKELTPNGVRNVPVSSPDVLCVAMLYIAMLMSLRIMSSVGVNASSLFRQSPLHGTIVLIFEACTRRPMSLQGVKLVSSLLWNAWSLWPFIFSPAALWHLWFWSCQHPAIIWLKTMNMMTTRDPSNWHWKRFTDYWNIMSQ